MPIPKPHDDESEDDFLDRCMSNDAMVEDYPDTDQRLAVCGTTWRNRNKALIEAIERKSISLTLDDEKEGSFIAKIAELDVIDADGDETKPGAFKDNGEVLVSAYQHGSWMGSLPVGKATITEEGKNVLAAGEFNLKSEAGLEHYQAVKFSGELQEWSYGFKVEESEEETRDGQKIRVLKKVTVFEISPVLLGAGVDTGTLAIKADKRTYADHAEMALAAVTQLVDRTKALAALRRKEGRVLSSKNRERMKKLLAMLKGVASDLQGLLDATEPRDDEKLAQCLLLASKIKRELSEVI